MDVTPDLCLRLRRVKVKALNSVSLEYCVKRVPEREIRGANVQFNGAPPQKPEKSQIEPKPDRQGHSESNLVSTEPWELLCALQRADLSDLERPAGPERRPNAKI